MEDPVNEIVVCGRLPRRPDRTVNLHKVERLLRDVADTAIRVQILKRVMEAGRYKDHA